MKSINQHAQLIADVARNHYLQSELRVLDELRSKTEKNIHLMGDLTVDLRCEPTYLG